MKKTIYLTLFILSANSWAKPHIIVDTIWQSINSNTPYEKQIIQEEDNSKKIIMDQGNKNIQEQLQRNREKLQLMRGVGPGAQSGEDIIKEQLRKNRAILKAKRERDKAAQSGYASLQEEAQAKMGKLQQRVQTNQIELKKREQGYLKKWKKAEEKFLRSLAGYKENLVKFDPPVFPIDIKDLRKPIKQKVVKSYHVIKEALELSARDQGRRPTCSAFAGIRAIEILMMKSEMNPDLSEQYFYWSSKPKCRQTPCRKPGSWVTRGYEYSQKQGREDIPVESNCTYNSKTKKGNETQLPLSPMCFKGKVQVKNFERLKTLDQTLTALNQNYPVIAGIKLSDNFYKNNGFVFLSGVSNDKKNLDSHAKGHAVLLIGHMKLPKKLWAKEGKVCFVTANSWGLGWGKGGHSCLSENWLRQYRIRNPFVALKSIKIAM